MKRLCWTPVPLLLLAACGGDQTAPESGSPTLEAVSPQMDTVQVYGTRLLTVRAVDERGHARAGVVVQWQPFDERDVIRPVLDTTDADGLSSATLQVGYAPGMHGATATTGTVVSRSFGVLVLSVSMQLRLDPDSLSLTPRQTWPARAVVADLAGNPFTLPLRWGTGDGNIATVDTTGVVHAIRPGGTFVYVSTTVEPFLVDSFPLIVRVANAARVVVHAQPEQLILQTNSRFSATAFDSTGAILDAANISWKLPANIDEWKRETFPDSSVIWVKPKELTSGNIEANVAATRAAFPVQVVNSPLVDVAGVEGSYCYPGVTVGPSGQWYYVFNLNAGRLFSDTFAVVKPGLAGVSSWSASATFTECDRRYVFRPAATISVDAAENLYVPTTRGVLSINGTTGATRWEAAIGPVVRNIAIATDRVIAARDSAVYALDKRDGRQIWSNAVSAGGTVTVVVDESRRLVYATGFSEISGFDLQSGDVKWRLLNVKASNLAIASNGDVYAGGNGMVWRITPNGTVAGTHAVDGAVVGSPLIDAAGNIYVATYANHVYSFTAQLASRWDVKPEPYFPSQNGNPPDAPVIDRDGTVYFGFSYDMHAVRDGRVIWTWNDFASGSGRGYENDWVIARDGFLYVPADPSFANGVKRIRTAGLDPLAQWPMTHHDAARTAAR